MSLSGLLSVTLCQDRSGWHYRLCRRKVPDGAKLEVMTRRGWERITFCWNGNLYTEPWTELEDGEVIELLYTLTRWPATKEKI